MKALVVEKAADRSLQDLNFAEVSVPTPAEHEVLIKVHAAGLNPVDYKIVEGGVSAWRYSTYPWIGRCWGDCWCRPRSYELACW